MASENGKDGQVGNLAKVFNACSSAVQQPLSIHNFLKSLSIISNIEACHSLFIVARNESSFEMLTLEGDTLVLDRSLREPRRGSMSPMYLPEEQKMLRAWQTNALHIMAKEP